MFRTESNAQTCSSSLPRPRSLRPHTLIELLDEALEEAADDDVRLARILGQRAWIRIFQADIRRRCRREVGAREGRIGR